MNRALAKRIEDRTAMIAVVGLGYVGLPTSVIFAEKGFHVIGCEVRPSVVRAIQKGKNPLEDLRLGDRITKLVRSGKLEATTDVSSGVRKGDIVLIAVPTPVREGFEPDLRHVISAGESIAKGLRKGQLVVLESTVYPGVTEEVLKPILERSGLRARADFGLVYCPERYNPGDSSHGIDQVARIVGGIDSEWTGAAALLYRQITEIHEVSSIRTAEMAKIIENTQRDLNIALMNEIALICEKMGLDIIDVIKAAATKWNFEVYYPGPGVGGHCLPKDPWYLVKAAEKVGYHAQIITAGRRINDSMPHHLFQLLVKAMNAIGKPIRGSKIAILGLSYKENVSDTRNSPAAPLIREIKSMGGSVHSVDPYVDAESAIKEFRVDEHHKSVSSAIRDADSIVLVTAHPEFRGLRLQKIRNSMARDPIFVDGRRAYDSGILEKHGFVYIGVGKG